MKERILNLAILLEALAKFTSNQDRSGAFIWVAELLKKILEDEDENRTAEASTERADKKEDSAGTQ